MQVQLDRVGQLGLLHLAEVLGALALPLQLVGLRRAPCRSSRRACLSRIAVRYACYMLEQSPHGVGALGAEPFDEALEDLDLALPPTHSRRRRPASK